jgi:hypothetical protein
VDLANKEVQNHAMRRASSDDGSKEQAIWRAAKLVALFLLSFGLAFRFYAGLDTATGGPIVRQRSLREEASPAAAGAGSAPLQQLLVSDQRGAAVQSGAAQLQRCAGLFGRCKAAHGHRLVATGAVNGSLPAYFDWEAYLQFYPWLRRQGITSELAAADHYLRIGRAQGRVGRRLRLLLRYIAGTGLINQHYSHVAALGLATMLGARWCCRRPCTARPSSTSSAC